MQVFFDKVKYEADEKEVKRTYRKPNKVLGFLYAGLAASIIMVFNIFFLVSFANIKLELLKPLALFVVVYTMVLFLGVCVVNRFQKPCPANTLYGDAVTNNVVVSENIEYDVDKKEACLCVVTKPLKNKKKPKETVHLVPLTDMGYYNGITEDYIVLASENKTRGLLYRPIEPYIQELQQIADNKTAPVMLIDAEKRKAKGS